MSMNINRELVKTLRLNKSWSQEKLAEEAGVSLRTIQRVETEGFASLQSRKGIAHALGVPPSELIPQPETAPDINVASSAAEQAPSSHVANKGPNYGADSGPTYVADCATTLYLLLTLRWLALVTLSLIMAILVVAVFVIVLGAIFFWQYTSYGQWQSAGAGLIGGIMLVPVILPFWWLYRLTKSVQIKGPAMLEMASLPDAFS